LAIDFPYDRYETLTEPVTTYYPKGAELQAHQVSQIIHNAAAQLALALARPVPELEILLVTLQDWELAPHDDVEELDATQPYWTAATTPPTIVVPVALDGAFSFVLDESLGEMTPEKFAFALYHEAVLALLEDDPRPWPEEYPLWADEWQIKFAALWLAYKLDGQQGVVNKDLHEQYAEIFEPEPDGKTPVTVRGFDWFEDTDPEEYLCYELLLERFAADLLSAYTIDILPRFLDLYRRTATQLLSDDVTNMLVSALGPGSEEWLEALVYF
jgi:hypothetical protein